MKALMYGTIVGGFVIFAYSALQPLLPTSSRWEYFLTKWPRGNQISESVGLLLILAGASMEVSLKKKQWADLPERRWRITWANSLIVIGFVVAIALLALAVSNTTA